MTNLTRCPVCGTTAGHLERNVYYCPECCEEFNPITGSRYRNTKGGSRVKITGTEEAKKPYKPRGGNHTNRGEYPGINYWRLKNGFTWRELSKITGIRLSAMHNYSTGRYNVPPESVETISHVLGVGVEDLKRTYPQEEIMALQKALDGRGRIVTSEKLKQNPAAGRPTRPVYCRETGQIYPSMYIAAKTLNLSNTQVWKVCHGEAEATSGYHFEFVKIEA